MKKLIYILLPLLSCIISCKDDKPTIDIPEGLTQYGTPMEILPETEDIVMYEVNMRAFSQTGDFQGVLDRIDEIDALGINVLWLMPIHPIGQINSVNSPYSVQNYLQVNPEFGTLEDLRNLIDAAHERDMAVIIDWVANHTAWDNPWITNKDWYTQDNGEIIHPPGTNWQDVADLNFANEDMRIEMIESMKYWVLEANIDGFRCDAADYVPLLFWRQAIDSLTNIPDRELILLAEGARKDHFTAGFQMNYSWDYYGQLKSVFNGASASGLLTTNTSEYADLPTGKEKLRFTTNHDESAWDATPITLFGGKEGAMAASVIATYMGGVPLIYGSQEVGRTSTIPFFSNSPIDWTQNPDMLTFYQDLITFYNSSEALKTGELQGYEDQDVVLFERKNSAESVLVIVNIRSSNTTLKLPENLQYSTWTLAFDQESFTFHSEINLSPYEFMILHK